ncbi:beta-glucosidase [Pseudothermotoga thermarum]|uniref:Beta-glucosidase n=1 Tax=Pseudothermotoga thermarum DSM 5069 TaxID=688269 RepID=F7YVT1_9THEM|nr:glycoside hydrolase family 3 protein [Pseudothermotoga thermarum]AEH51751.1 beta-glucosidase [Pseudothermotoga thermarum DSM 5069]
MKEVNEILSKLTLEEKVKLVVGVGMPGFFGNPPSKVHGAAGETHPIPRLGMPAAVLADGPAGLRINPTRENDEKTYHATAFPVETMLASTWNKELLEKVGQAVGEEVREYGVDILLAPAMNIHRNPLCGRNFEYYSEDPVLSGEMAAAFVKGVQSQGVGACVKHFVANEQETNRMQVDTIVSERALREIYLKAFEIAIKKAKPWTVMSAYNKLNGKYCSQNAWLLKKVLREDWGFEGFVMSDWYAGDNPVEQIKAGNDLIMPGKTYQVNFQRKDEIEEIMQALKEGKLSEDELNECVRNILNVLLKTPSFRKYSYSNKPDLDAHAKIAYEAGAEGVVLLKNNDVLPFDKTTPFALFGTGQIETIKGGTGSGDTHPRYIVSILDGIKEAGLKVDEQLMKRYEDYIAKMRETEQYKPRAGLWGTIEKPKLPENFLSEDEIKVIAERNDVGIIVISRISGEGYDRKPIKGDFYLSDDEFELIQKVSSQFHKLEKKVLVILNIGSPIEIASWRDMVDGILLIWQAGQETGRIVADTLVGKINPSGKLPTTFPKDYKDIPSWNFPGEPVDNPQKVVYEEDIYVGYRYYDTFNVEPAYEFGFGLSYTKFEYKDLNVSLDGDLVKISYVVTNVGKYPGKEISQVYVKAPKGKINKPFQELKAFHKTRLLNPGESETINLEIPLRELASFVKDEWFVEKGEYEIRIGASSRDIRLRKIFSIEKERTFKP